MTLEMAVPRPFLRQSWHAENDTARRKWRQMLVRASSATFERDFGTSAAMAIAGLLLELEAVLQTAEIGRDVAEIAVDIGKVELVELGGRSAEHVGVPQRPCGREAQRDQRGGAGAQGDGSGLFPSFACIWVLLRDAVRRCGARRAYAG